MRPPGYAAELLSPPGALARTVRLSFLYGFALLACDQLLLVQPRLYLAPFGDGIEHAFIALGVVALGAGGYVAHRLKRAAEFACLALALGAALVALSAYARFFAFAGSRAENLLACAPAWAAATALGFTLVAARSTAARWLRLDDGLWLWLCPFPVAGTVASLTAAAILANAVGPLRSSVAIAAGLLLAALFLNREVLHRSSPRLHDGLSGALYVLLCLTAVFTEGWCPLGAVLGNVHPLVYRTETEKSRYEVTAGQGGLHYFVDGELRFSSMDQKRWAESLTLPALARLAHPKRALVLSLGEGLIERELLAFAPKLRVTSVMRDGGFAALSTRQWFLSELTRGSLRSTRVALVEREPAVFARNLASERFDVIIVDLPDPAGPRQHKYYTRRFYADLGAHLEERGLLVVQATSARRSPRSYATIGATLRAAGFVTTPLMVPLMTRGEWSLYVATKGPLPPVVHADRYRTTFPGSIEEQMMNPWPDTRPPSDFVAEPNTQHDAQLMEWFDYETDHPNHG